MIESVTPVLAAERIEPVLPFWRRFAYTAIVEVPQGDVLVFVILSNGRSQVMYQSVASLQEDLKQTITVPSLLYLKVESIDAIEKLLEASEIVIPRRTTFYGATEIFVRDPAGNIIGFAQ